MVQTININAIRLHLLLIFCTVSAKTECRETTCSGNGECLSLIGGSSMCICNAGYTAENCDVIIAQPSIQSKLVLYLVNIFVWLIICL